MMKRDILLIPLSVLLFCMFVLIAKQKHEENQDKESRFEYETEFPYAEDWQDDRVIIQSELPRFINMLMFAGKGLELLAPDKAMKNIEQEIAKLNKKQRLNSIEHYPGSNQTLMEHVQDLIKQYPKNELLKKVLQWLDAAAQSS